MTQNLPNQTPTQPKPGNQKTRTQVRADTERMLRDLAFVLKMTNLVRAEIEAEADTQELIPV